MGQTASKAGTLAVCQWVKTGTFKVQGETDLTWGLTGETLVPLLETGSEKGTENGKEGGNFLHKTKTRVETLAPMEQEGAIPETKMEGDGVSLGVKQEMLSATVTQTTTHPSPKEVLQVQPVDYLAPRC